LPIFPAHWLKTWSAVHDEAANGLPTSARYANNFAPASNDSIWPISAVDQSRKAVGIFSAALHLFD